MGKADKTVGKGIMKFSTEIDAVSPVLTVKSMPK